MSPSTRRAWIEIRKHQYKRLRRVSPSTRRAWIEIKQSKRAQTPVCVALHPEGVDRNLNLTGKVSTNTAVALHPEGVDRNLRLYGLQFTIDVALHPEGVDRNKRA